MLGTDDPVLTREPLQAMVDDWRAFLSVEPDDEIINRLRLHTRTGWPLGSPEYLRRLEAQTGMVLTPQKRGRPMKDVGYGEGE